VRLRNLAQRVDPGLVSEHLSWSAIAARTLPISAAAVHRGGAIDRLPQRRGCAGFSRAPHPCRERLVVPALPPFDDPEWEFVATLAGRTGCGILCDVNNVFVSACNHGFDPRRYLHALPAGRIGEIHLAGHQVRNFEDGARSHRRPRLARLARVWALYADALALFGRVPTLIEWEPTYRRSRCCSTKRRRRSAS